MGKRKEAEEDEEELRRMWEERVSTGKELERKLQHISVPSIAPLVAKLKQELKFLTRVEKRVTGVQLETTNISLLSLIVSVSESYSEVTHLLATFALTQPSTNITFKHVVDIVADGGACWVKVYGRSARRLATEWLSGSKRTAVHAAETYLDHATLFPHHFRPPRVLLHFVNGIADKLAAKLRSLGAEVVGQEIPLEALCKVPEDILEDLMEGVEEKGRRKSGSGDIYLSPSSPSPSSLPSINLDVSTVFVLISNLTHPGGTCHRFGSTLLSEQAGEEERKRARELLLEEISGRRWIICQTAHDAVHKIVATVAGQEEKQRLSSLLPHLRVIPDEPSQRALDLIENDKVSKRAKIVFGTGDFVCAVTATANKHFVQAAYHQGVQFACLIHESRALSEQKELPS